jgi:hypothetical protein
MALDGITQAASPAKNSALILRIALCEQPILEIKALSDAIEALSVINCDMLAIEPDERDQTICCLTKLIRERVKFLDKGLFPNAPALVDRGKESGQ